MTFFGRWYESQRFRLGLDDFAPIPRWQIVRKLKMLLQPLNFRDKARWRWQNDPRPAGRIGFIMLHYFNSYIGLLIWYEEEFVIMATGSGSKNSDNPYYLLNHFSTKRLMSLCHFETAWVRSSLTLITQTDSNDSKWIKVTQNDAICVNSVSVLIWLNWVSLSQFEPFSPDSKWLRLWFSSADSPIVKSIFIIFYR